MNKSNDMQNLSADSIFEILPNPAIFVTKSCLIKGVSKRFEAYLERSGLRIEEFELAFQKIKLDKSRFFTIYIINFQKKENEEIFCRAIEFNDGFIIEFPDAEIEKLHFQYFHEVLLNLSFGIINFWSFNTSSKTIKLNRDANLRLGLPIEKEVDIFEFLKFLHPEDANRYTSTLHECISGNQKSINIEYRIKSHGENFRWLKSIGRVILEEANGTLFWGYTLDISKEKEAEIKLQQEHSKLSKYLDSIPTYIAIADQRGKLSLLNEALKRVGHREITESNHDVFLTDDLSFTELVNTERQEIVWDVFNRVLESENNYESYSFESQLHERPDQTVSWTCTKLTDPFGKIQVLITGNNITSQRRIETAFLKTTEELKAIQNALPDLIFVFNEDSEILDYYANEKQLLLVPREDIIGTNIRNLMDPIQSESIANVIKECAIKGEDSQLNYYVKTVNSTDWYEARFVAMSARRVLCVVRDITKEKHLQEDLEYHEEFLESLIELALKFINAPIDLISSLINEALTNIIQRFRAHIGLIHYYDFKNRSANLMYCVASDKAMEEHFESELQSISLSSIPQLVASHLAGKTTSDTFSENYKAPGAVPNWIADYFQKGSMHTIPLQVHQECHGFLTFITETKDKTLKDKDLSLLQIIGSLISNLEERKQTDIELTSKSKELEKANEELKQLNQLLTSQNAIITEANIALKEAKDLAEGSDKLKSTFLNMISHELRTPLNGIIGLTSFLQNDDLSAEEVYSYIKPLEESTDRFLFTINNIIDGALILSGSQKPSFKKVDLKELLFDISTNFSTKSIPDNIIFSLDKEALASINNIAIYTDPDVLVRIIEQLLRNAFKFTKSGEVKLGIKQVGDQIAVVVSDTGIGISPESHKRIFDFFRQEDESMTRQFEGIGLGLSIAKGLADLLNGRIDLESEKGKGSVFSIVLPFNSNSPTDPTLHSSEKKTKIIIAEDEEYNLIYLQALLNFPWIQILTAYNGKQAIALANENPDVACIIMDIRMPGTDGLSASKLIKKRHPNIPIIVISAYTLSNEESNFLSYGCDAFIAKPFTRKVFFETLSKIGVKGIA